MSSLDDLYKIAFETWRFQVNSYWSRNSYFAVFETAAVAGMWKLTDRHRFTAVVFALLCGVLTWIWGTSSRRSHEYVRFWWEETTRLEKHYANSNASTTEAVVSLVSGFESWRDKYRDKSRDTELSYSKLIRLVPWLFGIGWA